MFAKYLFTIIPFTLLTFNHLSQNLVPLLIMLFLKQCDLFIKLFSISKTFLSYFFVFFNNSLFACKGGQKKLFLCFVNFEILSQTSLMEQATGILVSFTESLIRLSKIFCRSFIQLFVLIILIIQNYMAEFLLKNVMLYFDIFQSKSFLLCNFALYIYVLLCTFYDSKIFERTRYLYGIFACWEIIWKFEGLDFVFSFLSYYLQKLFSRVGVFIEQIYF